jgi:hypothetical protein
MLTLLFKMKLHMKVHIKFNMLTFSNKCECLHFMLTFMLTFFSDVSMLTLCKLSIFVHTLQSQKKN